MKVVFRTDASLEIGTGHVIRCLTLADALRQRGASCKFICRDHPGNMIDFIRRHGHEVTALSVNQGVNDISDAGRIKKDQHADWLGSNWETDAEQTIVAVGTGVVSWIVVDHYAIDFKWEKKLRSACKNLMVIDDLANRTHNCDVLLDQNLVPNLTYRYDKYIPVECLRLLGPNFALLQPVYSELRSRTSPRLGPIQNLLVYFGGTDQHNFTGLTLSAFLSLKRSDLILDVVIGPGNLHATAIRQQIHDRSNITLHEMLPTLALLMQKADLAIGAGGATTWERLCLGLPSLVVTLADNQISVAEALSSYDIVRYLGNYDAVTESILMQALQAVMHESCLEKWSRDCMNIVDGKGVDRVVSIMMLDSKSQLKVRLAKPDDETLLLCWANDPVVRESSFNPQFIDEISHRKWFSQRLQNYETCRLYIVETVDGLPIGQARFERHQNEWEIHYSMCAIARGKQLGKVMLNAAIRQFETEFSKEQLFGRVKIENLASQKLFKNLAFKEVQCGSELRYYRKA